MAGLKLLGGGTFSISRQDFMALSGNGTGCTMATPQQIRAGHLQSLKPQRRYPRRLLYTGSTENRVQRHRFLSNRILPTALVSTTKDVVRTLKGVYDKHYIEDEDVKDMYLTIINIAGPGSERPDPDLQVHSAVRLARAIELDAESQRLFKDECLFEWEIPQRYVVNRVSLRTLRDRGFAMESYRISDEGGTDELRKRVYEADTSREQLTPCFKCTVHVCADGRDLRVDPEAYVQEGRWNPSMLKKPSRDCSQSY